MVEIAKVVQIEELDQWLVSILDDFHTHLWEHLAETTE